MQRETVLVLVLALLALLGLGVAAATLTDTTSLGEVGSGGGTNTGGGSGDLDRRGQGNGSLGSGSAPVTRGLPAPTFCAEWLQTPEVIGAILGVFLLLWAVAYYDTGSPLPGVALVVAFGIPVFMIWYVLTACGSWKLGLRANGTTRNVSFALSKPGGSAGGAGKAAGEAVSTPSIALGLLLVLAIAVALLMLFVSTGDAVETEAEPDEEERSPTDVTAVGRAAGRAADRIEREADVENEVFRAWAEMTDHLAVDRPASSTPAEFAEAAVEAGMDPDDVRELTDLFETVRYGGAAPTEERESRALGALRRIESGYAESDGGGEASDDAGGSGVSDR